MEKLHLIINEEPNVRPLTKKEIIKFCNDTIKEIKLFVDGDIPSGIYLCERLGDYLIKLNNFYNKKEKSFYIPEFTNENAVKYCNGWVAKNHEYWWSGNLCLDGYDSRNRIKFLKWIKSQYVTPKKNIIPEEK